MHPLALLSALVAIGSSVVFAQSASTCTKDIRITEPTPTISCDVVDANVVVDDGVAGTLSIEGPKQLKKDFIINATKLISVSSSTINSVDGKMHLEGLLLSSISIQSLESVNIMELINLPQLNAFTFGASAVAKAKSITISDTFISDLVLNILTAERIEISNNSKLTNFTSALVANVTKYLGLTNNGNNMQIQLPSLANAGDMQFRGVKMINIPVLSRIESLKINDSPELPSVAADNLTEVFSSLTFINNKELDNLSFKALRIIKGDMTIQNNTALTKINGFSRLETVGNILLRGVFEEVDLPSLKDVKGSAIVTSTTDISSFCKYFDDLKSKGDIRGKESCTSNNKNANEGGNGGQTNQDNKDAAGMVSVNMAMLGLALFAGIAQLL